MNIHPVGTELFHANGQTGVTKLVVTFRNFARAPIMKWLDTFSYISSIYDLFNTVKTTTHKCGL